MPSASRVGAPGVRWIAVAGMLLGALPPAALAQPDPPPAPVAEPDGDPEPPTEDAPHEPGADGAAGPDVDAGASPPEATSEDDPAASQDAPDEADPPPPPTKEQVEQRVEREEGSLGTLTEPGVVTVEQLRSVQQTPEGEPAAPEQAEGAPAAQVADGANEPGETGRTPAPPQPAPDHEGALGDLAEPSTTKKAEDASSSATEPPDRLGPASIRINDRGDRITLGFATQLRFELNRGYDPQTDESELENGLEFRRMRTILSSSFLDGRVRSSFQLNIAPNAFELIDAWGLYAPIRKLALRLGQFKIPFTRYRAQSFAALSRTDWSPVTRMFGAERQIGIEALNPAPTDTSVEYSMGLFTGQNARASQAVGLTEVYGDTPQNPSNLRSGYSSLTPLSPELVARAARNFGAIDTGSNTDTLRGPLRHSLGWSAAGDFQPEPTQDLTLRLATEWLAKFHGAYVNAAVYVAWFPETTGGTAFGPYGWMLETGYRFDRTWELTAAYTQIGISKALQRDAQAYATQQLMDPDLDDSQREQYMAAGRQSRTAQLVTTASAYLVGHSLKGQMEFGWNTEMTESGRGNELYGRLQFQLQF